MSKNHTLLENRHIRDAAVFVRHACEVISNYRADPAYMPSKSDLHRFRRIREDLDCAARLATQIHERMEGRFEGRSAEPEKPQ